MGTLGPEARNIGGGSRKSLASEGVFEAGGGQWDPAEFDEEPLKEETNYVQIMFRTFLCSMMFCLGVFNYVHRFYLHGHLELVFRNMDPIIPIVLWFAYEQMHRFP